MIGLRAFFRPWVLAISLLMVPSDPASAQVRVRSGEHPGHSRLVFQFQTLPEWNLVPGTGWHLLEFTPAPSAYLLDEVFRFIPRTRVSDVRADPNGTGIVIELNCDCRIEVFETRGQALVFDVHDPHGDRQDPFEWATIDDLASMNPRFMMAHTPEDAPEAPEEEQSPELSTLPPVLEDTSLFPFPSLPPDDVLLHPGLTQALANQLARAASQGLIAADTEMGVVDDTSGGPLPDEARDSILSQSDDLVRLRTGLDSALRSIESTPTGLSSNMSCPNAALFGIDQWGRPDNVHAQIATFRRQLMGEFDRANDGVVLGLARLYIYLTFDDEAVNLIERLSPKDEAQGYLKALARLVGSGLPDRRLAGFAECGGTLPLLAFLATTLEDLKAPVRQDAVLLTYLNLPPHLRRHLAEPLAERFAALGDTASVDVVLGAVGRISKKNDPDLLLATARGFATGELPSEAGAALDDLATSLKPEAAEALLINLRDRLARERRIPQDLIDTAEVLAVEQRGSPEGQELREVHIASLFANGAYLEGFEVLSDADEYGWMTEEQIARAWRGAYTASLYGSEDVTFTRILFDRQLEHGLAHLDGQLRNRVAERLLQLGFPSRGEEIFVKTGDPGETMLLARLARARMDDERAVRLARSAEDRNATTFVAETLVASGRHAEATEIYASIGAAHLRSREAWRAGEWSLVFKDNDPVRYEAAAEMLALENASEDEARVSDMPSLASTAALIEESVSLRRILDTLLASSSR